jgi:hypothetical protein
LAGNLNWVNFQSETPMFVAKLLLKVVLAGCGLALMTSVAHAGVADSGYLAGRWELNAPDCGGKDSEFLVFRDDGIFENGRRGKTEALGFWQVADDVITLEMLSSPAFFKDIAPELSAYNGQYGYFNVRAVTFGVEKDRFGMVAVMADQISKITARRCP